jgi:hypothetical protein
MKQSRETRSIEWAYAYGFFLTLGILCFSFISAYLFNTYYRLSAETIHSIELVGLIFDGTALFGVVRITVHSLKGLLTLENMNHKFLQTCVTLGMTIWFLTHFLKPAA